MLRCGCFAPDDSGACSAGAKEQYMGPLWVRTSLLIPRAEQQSALDVRELCRDCPFRPALAVAGLLS
jgi:hypothetical protein